MASNSEEVTTLPFKKNEVDSLIISDVASEHIKTSMETAPNEHPIAVDIFQRVSMEEWTILKNESGFEEEELYCGFNPHFLQLGNKVVSK
jgi:hypothetical protein